MPYVPTRLTGSGCRPPVLRMMKVSPCVGGCHVPCLGGLGGMGPSYQGPRHLGVAPSDVQAAGGLHHPPAPVRALGPRGQAGAGMKTRKEYHESAATSLTGAPYFTKASLSHLRDLSGVPGRGMNPVLSLLIVGIR